MTRKTKLLILVQPVQAVPAQGPYCVPAGQVVSFGNPDDQVETVGQVACEGE